MKVTKIFVFLVLSLLMINIAIAQFSINLDLVNDSCSNGIKDNGETGIDCGGPCVPCDSGTPNTGGSSSPSGSSPIIKKNYTLNIEIPKEITVNYTEHNLSFSVSEDEELFLTISVVNLANTTQDINVSVLEIPDFLKIFIEPAADEKESLLIINSNINYYKEGNYTTILILQGEEFMKKIKLDFEIKGISEPLVELPREIEPETSGFDLVLASIIFVALVIVIITIFILRRKI